MSNDNIRYNGNACIQFLAVSLQVL